MKKIVLVLLVLCLSASVAYAKKVRYIFTDNKFDYIKVEELGKKELKGIELSQPHQFDIDKLRNILASLKLDRTFIVKEQIQERRIFDDAATNFLAPKLLEAFAMAGPRDKVVISYLNVDAKFVFRSDRLIIAEMWIEGGDLHVRFEKLFAKLTGDYTKRGDLDRRIQLARGLRISLEVQDGQELSSKDPSEVIVHMDYDFAASDQTELVVKDTEAKIKRDEKKTAERAAKAAKAGNAGVANAVVAADTVNAASPIEKRLKELQDLYDKKLITKEEYASKKKDILNGL